MKNIELKNPKVLIVNASSLHHSEKLGPSMWQFAFLKFICNSTPTTPEELQDLFKKRSHWSLLTNIHMRTAFGEVTKEYQRFLTAINSYKLGKFPNNDSKEIKGPFIQTKLFIGQLQKFFPGIEAINYPENIRKKIFKEKKLYLCLHGQNIFSADQLTGENIAHALIEEAWGCRIRPYHSNEKYGNDFIKRIEALAQETKKSECKLEEIRIISNSNEIDMHRFLVYLNQFYSDYFFHPESIEQDSDSRALLIGKINGKSVYLDVSYNYKQFKIAENSKGMGTDSLIDQLAVQLEAKKFSKNKIVVISQWSGDINKAKSIGMTAQYADSVLPPIHYFNKTELAAAGALGIAVGAMLPFSPIITLSMCSVITSADWALSKKLNFYDIGPHLRSISTGVSFGLLAGQGVFSAVNLVTSVVDNKGAEESVHVSLTN